MRVTQRNISTLLATLVIALFPGCTPSDPAGELRTSKPQPLVEGNTAFALDLYARFKSQQGNLFFSPYGISTCLAMACAGAKGNTEKQMVQVLHFPHNPEQLHASFGELQRGLNALPAMPTNSAYADPKHVEEREKWLVDMRSKKGLGLEIANALWTQDGDPFLPGFLNLVKQQYEANANQADFRTKAGEAAAEISQWVSDRTKGQIKDIVQPGSLNTNTSLVLVNAVHFKGAWAEPFWPYETTNQPFYLADGRKTEVPLMHLKRTFRYAEDAKLQIIELPYQFTDISMLILLPRKHTGLSDLESKLTPDNLSKWLSPLKVLEVDLFLPKFKLQSSFQLAAELAAMGMPDAFHINADFSGIDGTRNLFISSVFHKASGEINEEGTEASAGTAEYVLSKGGHMQPPSPPPVFRADHPFIVLIRDRKSGSIVLLGRLVDPTK